MEEAVLEKGRPSKSKKKDVKEKKPESTLSKVTSWVMTGLIVLLAIFWVVGVRFVTVHGSSMEDTYHNGDLLLGFRVYDAEALTSRNHPACVVILEDGTRVIKRLIGIPGDHVELTDGDTYVNGELIMHRNTASWDNLSYDLGEDDWLFLGDNRANSYDGRNWPDHFVGLSSIKYFVIGSELA